MAHSTLIVVALVLSESVCPFAGGSPTSSQTVPTAGIELAEVGVPSGWMGADPRRIKDAIRLEGAEAAECGGTSKCLRITYRPQWGWAGLYWWPTACDLESDAWAAVESGECGIDLRNGPDSRPIQRLTFAARGAKGDETLDFGVGGHALYPKTVQRRVVLDRTWQTFEIDLRKADLKKVTGLFFWTASNLENPTGFVVYLKDVRFTGAG